ncbi:MAG: 3-hydroxyacyl-ACP dehydratase FabZ family protein [Algisphaera sp.]
MAPTLLFPIDDIDLTTVVYDTAAVEATNPHRGHLRLLDAITYESECRKKYAAYFDVKDDQFWVAGHIPGRPIFPGVLMIEAAAQLCSFMTLRKLKDEGFMGFVGVDDVKFRGQVVPGDRLALFMLETKHSRRRCTSLAQGWVDGKLTFEATIHGMPI